jgi:hypothetical protein
MRGWGALRAILHFASYMKGGQTPPLQVTSAKKTFFGARAWETRVFHVLLRNFTAVRL